jgi:hypothetical protein
MLPNNNNNPSMHTVIPAPLHRRKAGKLAIVAFAALTAMPAVAWADASVHIRPGRGVSINIGDGPPALRVERPRRQPSRRHVWIEGHWRWSDRRNDWVWVSGRWKVPPRGYRHWDNPRWERRGDRWVEVHGGRWRRD